MYKPTSPQDFIAHAPEHYRHGLEAMREVLLSTDMEENIKWNMPVYGYGKKNVATLFYAKSYLGVWFTHGALLSDPHQLLVNASPEKTVGQRQLRFENSASVDVELLREFVEEAVQNQKDGFEFTVGPSPETVVPPEMQAKLDDDPALAALFVAFAPYKQREFCEHISSAKRVETKERRLASALEMILAGEAPGDKYRKKP
ncbi:MAG: YdeI family protein [Lewinella sp.]